VTPGILRTIPITQHTPQMSWTSGGIKLRRY